MIGKGYVMLWACLSSKVLLEYITSNTLWICLPNLNTAENLLVELKRRKICEDRTIKRYVVNKNGLTFNFFKVEFMPVQYKDEFTLKLFKWHYKAANQCGQHWKIKLKLKKELHKPDNRLEMRQHKVIALMQPEVTQQVNMLCILMFSVKAVFRHFVSLCQKAEGKN